MRPSVSAPRRCAAAMAVLVLMVSSTAVLAAADTVPSAPAASIDLPPRGELPERSPNPVLDSYLHRLETVARDSDAASVKQFAETHGLKLDDGRVLVTLRSEHGTTLDASVLEAARGLGATVVCTSTHFADLLVPLRSLTSLSWTPGIAWLRPARAAEPSGPSRLSSDRVRGGSRLVDSEGVVLTGASVQQAAGHCGAGVRVAVIDGGFEQMTAAYSAGELGGDAWFCDFTGTGMETGGCHGTAVSENVCDMAPGVTLHMFKTSTQTTLENAGDLCVQESIDIVNYSMGWYGQPCNGQGDICAVVDSAYAAGILWVNSAGNNTYKHNEGVFTDADADDYHEFAPGDEILGVYLSLGEMGKFSLTWAGWPSSFHDFDFYLYDNSLNLVDWSTNYQSPGEPVESIYYTATYEGWYYLVIYRAVASLGVPYDITTGSYVQYPVFEGSVLAPSDSPRALAVGAIHKDDWYSGPIAWFSSQGPTNDGRIKPDIAGPDSCATFSYDPPGWWTGTSSASPHVAGAAALVKSILPGLVTHDDLRDWLTDHAIDMGDPGFDNVFGHGRLDIPPDTPVDDTFYAVYTPDEGVAVRWCLNTLDGAEGLHVLRSTSADAGFEPITDEPVPPRTTGSFVDASAWSGGTFWYRLAAVSGPGGYDVLDLPPASASVPGESQLALLGVTPNPSHGSSTVAFQLPASGASGLLSVYDIAGRRVWEKRVSGMDGVRQSVQWDGRCASGAEVASGVYFVLLEVGDRRVGERIAVLR